MSQRSGARGSRLRLAVAGTATVVVLVAAALVIQSFLSTPESIDPELVKKLAAEQNHVIEPVIGPRDHEGSAVRDEASELSPTDLGQLGVGEDDETKWRRVTGSTRREDNNWSVTCRMTCYDAGGKTLRSRMGQYMFGNFLMEVEQGTASIAFIPREKYFLDAVRMQIGPGNGAVEGLEVRLPEARGSIQGRIVDEAGAGVEGITVRLEGNYARRTTDRGGWFRFKPLRDRTYSVSVAGVPFTEGDNPYRQVLVEKARQAEGVLIVVERGATLNGIVTDPIGEPVANALVVLARPGSKSTHRSCSTDAAGRFVFRRLVAGEYEVIASVADGSYGIGSRRVGVAVRQERHIRIEMASGAGVLAGRLIDGDSSPLPFATVVADRVQEGEDGARVVSAGERWTARTDSRGLFKFAALPAGTWQLNADETYCESRNWIASQPQLITIHDGAETHRDVRLTKGSYLEGRVKSASERDGDILVRLRFGPDRTITKSTESGGQFLFGGLSTGSYTVEALDPRTPGGAPLGQSQVFVLSGRNAKVELQIP